MRRGAGLAAPLVAVVAISACDSATAGLHRRRDPGALVVAQAADIMALDPVLVNDNESIEVSEILFEGLARWKPGTTDVAPGLATAWEVSPDGLHWKFHLRSGVVFHDGTLLDADAVAFSFERVLDPKHPQYLADAGYWRTLLKDVRKVSRIDPMTIGIDVARPYAPLLGDLAMFPIVSPTAVRLTGAGFAVHPVGTGPFAFESWDRGEQVIVRRFDRYWGERPALERIVFRVVSDARQRLVDLQSGSVDLASSILPDEQSFVELHPDLVLHHTATNDVSYLAFNESRPPWDDLRVRRAVSQAINKEPIVKLAYQGRAIAADGPLPPGQWGYHVPKQRYAYDLRAAKKLLDEAIADHSFDPSLTYKLSACSTPRPYIAQPERVARYMQGALEQLGIKTELVLQPVLAHRRAVESGEHDLALHGWIGDTGDPDNFLYVLFHSDNAVPGDAQNVAFYRNALVDKLLIDAQGVVDEPTRSGFYAAVQDQIATDAVWVPIAHSELVVAGRAELEGVMLSPLGHLLYAYIRRAEPR